MCGVEQFQKRKSSLFSNCVGHFSCAILRSTRAPSKIHEKIRHYMVRKFKRICFIGFFFFIIYSAAFGNNGLFETVEYLRTSTSGKIVPDELKQEVRPILFFGKQKGMLLRIYSKQSVEYSLVKDCPKGPDEYNTNRQVRRQRNTDKSTKRMALVAKKRSASGIRKAVDNTAR